MIITLDDTHRIRGTDHCWQLEKLTKAKGETSWRAFKYFTTLTTALHEAAQREIRVYPANTLAEAFDACVRVTHKYAQIFDDVGRPPLRATS